METFWMECSLREWKSCVSKVPAGRIELRYFEKSEHDVFPKRL